MSYVVIEFSNGGGVAVVRNIWLTPRKKEVFWPPMKDQRTFDKILEKTVHADTEKWKLYPIQRCLFETGEHKDNHIKTQNTQLLALLRNKQEVLPLQKDFEFQFPMKSLHDVDHVEQILKEKTQIDILNAYLSTIGGRDVPSKVSRILKYLFIDTLAAKFSFYGKRLNKRPFSDLCLKSVIIDSIKRNIPGVDNKEIEDNIKIWLKHAPDREKNREKRRKQNE